MEHDRKVVEIFWTGGFDSTFRIVQLSRLDIEIQPYYISDNRDSEKNELSAIAEVTSLLKNHRETRCTFRPLIYIAASDRVEDNDISATSEQLRKTDYFGTQYDWLAVFAKTHNGIELSIHQDDKAILLINKYGKLKELEDEILGKTYILDTENSSKALCTLFSNYHFPLAQYTKVDMKDFYIKYDYVDIMHKTWFCYHPIKNKPCGMCYPCKYTIEEGMKERFSTTALLRYHLRYNKVLDTTYSTLKKMIKK